MGSPLGVFVVRNWGMKNTAYLFCLRIMNSPIVLNNQDLMELDYGILPPGN